MVLPTGCGGNASLTALPLESVTALPKFTPLVLNCTVPDGLPAPGVTAMTVLVKTTGWPNTEGLAEEVSNDVVSALFTVCVRTREVFALKLVSPLKTAVIKCVPTVNVVLV